MALTLGQGPFGHAPAGRFDFEPPASVTYVEPFPRRVRGVRGGSVVVDSDRVQLVHRSRTMPYWSFPSEDVGAGVDTSPDDAVDGHVRVDWSAVDEWFEEDERVVVHPRDPYHRVDCYSTTRRVRVSIGDVVLADTTAAVGLYETSLPVRWYLPPEEVRMDLLTPSSTTSGCPYKGIASYWSLALDDHVVEDVAWGYLDPLRESERVRGHLCFYDDKVTVVVSDA